MKTKTNNYLIIKNLFLTVLFFFQISVNAQEKKLEDLSFLELEHKIDSSYNKKEELWIFINQYIQKSKDEKNSEALIYCSSPLNSRTEL